MKSDTCQTAPSQVYGANRGQWQGLGGSENDPYRKVGFRGNTCGYGSSNRQISGSLQDNRLTNPWSEERVWAETQLMRGSQRIASVSIPNRSGVQRVSLPANIGDYFIVSHGDARQKSPEVETKVVASFVGKVECFLEDSAHVLLLNEHTGERLESRCDIDVLREKGIEEDGWFKCEVIRKNGDTIARISRLPTKKLSKEQIDRICEKYKDRWTF